MTIAQRIWNCGQLATLPVHAWKTSSYGRRKLSDVMGNEEIRSVSVSGGRKGTKLCRPDLIPPAAWIELATHFGVGAEKYTERDDKGNVTHDGANNWRLGYEWSKSIAALQRHMLAFMLGEDYDEETGSKHVIAVAWHAVVLATFMDIHPGFDDRPKAREDKALER